MKIRAKAKDDVLLLLSATACCMLAWGFWHFLGQAAFSTLLVILTVGLLADNVRLRRKLDVLSRGGPARQ